MRTELAWFILRDTWRRKANAVQGQKQEEGPEGRILSLFDQGKTVVEIGRETGLHHLSVIGALVKAKRIKRRRGPARKKAKR